METQYFSKTMSGISWYARLNPDKTTLQIQIGSRLNFAKVEMITYHYKADGAVECSEEEFNEACEKAMGILVSVLPVAA